MANTSAQPTVGLRERVRHWIEQPKVQNGILGLILVNAVLLGMETSSALMTSHGPLILALDHAILWVFVVELALRIYVHRLNFFKDSWNLFDLAVVVIALIPASGPFSVLRALRVLRVLRILTIVPSMRRVVAALLGAIPGLMSIGMVLLLIYYVFAVIATKLFGVAFPEWFGNLGRSLYTLFQIMTLESWSMGIARPVMEQFPLAWVFFVIFILIATFTMLNLFIAIIVNAMQSFTDAEQQQAVSAVAEAREHIEADLHQQMAALRQEIAELKVVLERQRS